MKKIKWGVLLVVAFAVALALPGNVAHVQPVYDHYKSYNVPFGGVSPPIDVVLTDQFGTTQGTVEFIRMYSFPVEKMLPGGEISPIVHPENHLTWYEFIGPVDEPERTLLVTNQFGTDQEWVVKDPVYLLLPTRNDYPMFLPFPTDLDHYLCYDVISGPPVGLDGVTLTDFMGHPEYVTVGDPMVFCNPVNKVVPDDGLPIYDNENHLACYDINPKYPWAWPMEVMTTDQFGFQMFPMLLENEYLCVPSEKRIKPGGCFASVAEDVE